MSVAAFYFLPQKGEGNVKNSVFDKKISKFNVNLGVEICDRFLYTFNKILKTAVGCGRND